MFLTQFKVTAVVITCALSAGATGMGMYAATRTIPCRNADANPVAALADQPKGDAPPLPAQRDIAADKAQSKLNLKRIGEAMHAYQTANQHLPTAAIYGPGDRPLLSWRVAILLYLGEKELYQQFRLNEPWDSGHNTRLLGKMPKVYAPAGVQTKEPNSTFYQVFFGPRAMFEGTRQITYADVRDGKSQTILAIEASEPVPWTKPQDLPFDREKELPKLGGLFDDTVHFVAVDGYVHTAKKGFDPKRMSAAVIRAGRDSKYLIGTLPFDE